ncbi:MAG: RdgB/HAM1 family non-canonical purine NTP pyrophosphatase [Gemmatimonadota bacterium]
MVQRKLLLATRNAHKVREIVELLEGLPLEVSSLRDIGIARLPGEDDVEIFGTFEQNALAKARFYRMHTGMDVVADDSGLCVDALEGGPGVRSRRFAADHGLEGADQDAANNQCLLRLLEQVEDAERSAHYRCALACVTADRTLVVGGRVDGRITRAERGRGGFGYDPLFLLPEYGQTFGELPPEVKAAISHRAEAIRSFRRWLEPLESQESLR